MLFFSSDNCRSVAAYSSTARWIGSLFGPPQHHVSGAFLSTSPSSLLRYSVTMPVA